MGHALRVGIIGDWNPNSASHVATNEALDHAAGALSVPVEVRWLSTPSLEAEGCQVALQQYDALWCAPGSPYRSMDGALEGIRFAREQGRPFIGT